MRMRRDGGDLGTPRHGQFELVLLASYSTGTWYRSRVLHPCGPRGPADAEAWEPLGIHVKPKSEARAGPPYRLSPRPRALAAAAKRRPAEKNDFVLPRVCCTVSRRTAPKLLMQP